MKTIRIRSRKDLPALERLLLAQSGFSPDEEKAVAAILAAVRRRVAMNDVGNEFKPALDQVWAFLGNNPGLRTDGHNVFLYHHESPEILPVDFGVEVVRTFSGEGEVQCVTTPAGEAAVVQRLLDAFL